MEEGTETVRTGGEFGAGKGLGPKKCMLWFGNNLDTGQMYHRARLFARTVKLWLWKNTQRVLACQVSTVNSIAFFWVS